MWREFNIFSPHLVLYDRKHFCSISTNLSNLSHSKLPFLFHQKFPFLSSDLKNVLTKHFPKMQPFANVLQNKCSNKFFDIHKKISVLQSLFNKVTGLMACIFITTQVFSRRKVTRRKKCGMRPYIYDVHSKSRWQVLKVVMYLWILLFLNNSSIVEFYGRSGWEGDHNIGDKCMTPKLVIFYDVHVSWM